MLPKPYYGLTFRRRVLHLPGGMRRAGATGHLKKSGYGEIEKKIEGKKLDNHKNRGKNRRKSNAPLLYDLTELQREANQKFGFSAKETLNIMQRLYENHKVLTYPRTDSRYLTSDVVGTIKERLQAINSGAYREACPAPLLKKKIKEKASFVNDSKVSDHHAIIPTEQAPSYIHMSNEEKKIYDMVVRRFLAVLYPSCEYEETILAGEIAGEVFYARGNRELKAGWKIVYESQIEEEEDGELKRQNLPVIKKKGSSYMFQMCG